MRRLRKKSPPAYPGRKEEQTTSSAEMQQANILQRTQQLLSADTNTNTNTPAAPGTLGNPTSPSVSSPGSPLRNEYFQQQRRSPIGNPQDPLLADTKPQMRDSPFQNDAVQPQIPGLETRKSAESRPDEGSDLYSAEPNRIVKVAQDMHDGALPPVYKRQASDPVQPTNSIMADSTTPSRPSSSHGCSKCGKRRMSNGEIRPCCNKCGKRKTTVQSVSFAMPPPVPSQSVPQANQMMDKPLPPTQSEAGPSTSPTSEKRTSPKSCKKESCKKCGRSKRPATASKSYTEPELRSSQLLPRRPLPQTSQSDLQIPKTRIDTHRSNQVGPKIDILPPTPISATRPDISPITDRDDSPLVAKRSTREFKFLRNSSLYRSLSRRSKKNRTSSAPLPSQQLADDAPQTQEQNAGRLINMLSNAIKEHGSNGADAQYAKINDEEPVDRPGSPFSFDGKADETDTFEMGNIKERLTPEAKVEEKSRWSFDKDEGERISPDVILEETTDGHGGLNSNEDTFDVRLEKRNSLNLPSESTEQGNLTGISRFKSLRGGITRFNSLSRPNGLSRSTSLKRLESLKSVHRSWYRNDMVFEGSGFDDCYVY